MKAAVVNGPGATPVYADFEAPAAADGYALIDVNAAALSHVTRAKAAGTHYSSSGGFPFVAGVDGVGRRDDGTRVYFFAPKAPFGSLAQRTLAPAANCVPLPDALDASVAAAIAIPGMSSWAALVERAKFVAGETVLVNGATGASGQLAVQIAKHLGPAKVIATGRHAETLAALETLGADCVIPLDQDERALSRAFEPHLRDGVDVVLDYLWGSSARTLLVGAATHLPEGHPLRFVQIGSIGGGTLELPAAVLRASAIALLGSGIGSVPLDRLLNAVREVLHAALPAGLRIDTRTVPLADVGAHWDDTGSRARTVFTVAG
ncbi:quinone oxidoreductase family protein [Paraburkholderia caballeronis]|uniref:quinone oxidoreductase family protein n=1 Tax=Paraburkholderia caballeronis TaxID=416943 RepID=UPI00106545E1|nr:zinc-binding alcohol dehydrogenase family protein [Paraburkholderia caballeronis]TDV05547.1 NADPH:quinone reductase-like Zn-dependent oxidoreductase [Paraburkholderia caballeronis]TDV09174.1 NADPH:quinone reductase-like Zn-dependent oxidoreductase [Paraburkholderia caballeronis]TDV20294.1 NADPH:quinone reductase-like Zn-dependent oxidoreductase [Paraburkholderia caballeronis]